MTGERQAKWLTRFVRLKLAYLLDLAAAPFVRPDETVIVSGFWRSGTTWLQALIAGRTGAKTVFEPFRFRADGMQAHYHRVGLPGGESLQRAFMPWGQGDPGRRLVLRVISRGLRATLHSNQVRMYRDRQPLRHSMRRRVVLKTVRAHLALDLIREAFPNPIVHISRDPRAVIASAVHKTDRMWGVFEPFDLAGQLLGVDDGRAETFAKWESEIRRLNEAPFAIQLAAYWALTERYLLDSLAGAGRVIVFARYEELAKDPASRIPALVERLGVPPETAGDAGSFRTDSPSTTRTGQTIEDRLFGWRELLAGEEAEKIAAIAHAFDLADRLVD
ncbi:MAG TPA: sulfotransferase [Anaerolineales bacterium]|nr:sulfotransferase [Anaerolineales bacterium]